MKTAQEIFNISYLHVLRQAKPSGYREYTDYGRDFRCQYRAEDGAQCAAGPFITKYDTKMETSGWQTVCELFPNSVDPSAIEHLGLVLQLQNAHDMSAELCSREEDFIDAFKERARCVAEQYRLEVPEEE